MEAKISKWLVRIVVAVIVLVVVISLYLLFEKMYFVGK
jgi:hypothetical protein